VQRHSISEVSQSSTGWSSQFLPIRRQPGDGVTWTRKGTLGSIAGWGDPPGPTIQALLIARPRLSRALWTSWSKMVVALVSDNQLTAFPPISGRGFDQLREYREQPPIALSLKSPSGIVWSSSFISDLASPLPECAPEVAAQTLVQSGDPDPECDP